MNNEYREDVLKKDWARRETTAGEKGDIVCGGKKTCIVNERTNKSVQKKGLVVSSTSTFVVSLWGMEKLGRFLFWLLDRGLLLE